MAQELSPADEPTFRARVIPLLGAKIARQSSSGPLVSNNRKEARARLHKRARTRASRPRRRVRSAFSLCGTRVPQRKWVRDYVDARWNFGEFLIPIMFAVIIATFLTLAGGSTHRDCRALWAFFARHHHWTPSIVGSRSAKRGLRAPSSAWTRSKTVCGGTPPCGHCKCEACAFRRLKLIVASRRSS